jgi:hypothetical protein
MCIIFPQTEQFGRWMISMLASLLMNCRLQTKQI